MKKTLFAHHYTTRKLCRPNTQSEYNHVIVVNGAKPGVKGNRDDIDRYTDVTEIR